MMADSIKSLQNLINTHYNLAHTKLKSSHYAPFQSSNEMISTTLNILIAYWKIIRLFRRFMYIVHNPPHNTQSQIHLHTYWASYHSLLSSKLLDFIWDDRIKKMTCFGNSPWPMRIDWQPQRQHQQQHQATYWIIFKKIHKTFYKKHDRNHISKIMFTWNMCV